MLERFRITDRIEGAALEVVVDGLATINGFPLHTGCAIFLPENLHRTSSGNARSLRIAIPSGIRTPDGIIAETTARAWAINLIQELESREPGWELATEGLILLGLARLTRLAELAARRPAWLDRALELVRHQTPLTEIAAKVGRHPSHVAREFHRHEGVTVGEYARRVRLELAAAALRRGEQSIAEIAIAAGFCDQSHFTNAFRRLYGVTPAKWQAQAS